MKRLLLFLVIVPVFFGCNKVSPSINNVESNINSVENGINVGDQWDGKSGLYINGKLETELRSAFAGGGTANPAEGHSNRMHIYEKYYSEGPIWSEVKEKVLINGFSYTGKTYSGLGETINRIKLSGLSFTDELYIPMNQGNYEGGNEQVSSVKIVKYSLGKYDSNGKQIENAEIEIEISLKDSQTISIIYSGLTPYDNYF